jgi:hypothetical protein
MQVGDLVKVKKGRFMGGLMGIIVSERQNSNSQKQFFVRLIGNVPTTLKHRPILYGPDRLIAIKSSNSRDQ